VSGFNWKVRASFLAAVGSIKVVTTKISATKNLKTKKKQRGGFAFFGYFFGEAKK
jgi:hypothetical protein